MIQQKPFAKMLGLVFGGALILAGCAGQDGTKMGMAEKAEQAVAKAETAVEKTRTETDGWGLWKSTKKILGNARASLEKGDYKAALDAARQARFQANKGLAQYREEQDQFQVAAKTASNSGNFNEASWVSGKTSGE
ncbi:hypothetical protein [Thiohalorhabdus methylotrophus]|uniref:DUF4398 domain-containing protein n=1 Tax=Thiohalorhabdus methylotrophus TaxID=3242694 RepID=A0ABV4TTX4_9GAMM